MRYIFKYFLVMIILTSCGYQPILSNKNLNFTFNDLKLSGDKSLSQEIGNNLKSFKNKNSENELEISSEILKSVISKDEKGNPNILELKLNVNIKILGNNEIEKKFAETISYNNNTSKFKLKQFERKQISNLAQKISKDIYIYLNSQSNL